MGGQALNLMKGEDSTKSLQEENMMNCDDGRKVKAWSSESGSHNHGCWKGPQDIESNPAAKEGSLQ